MLVRTLLMLFALISLPTAAIADFYVIGAGGRIAGTEIKSLPYTISSSGFYYITKDLTCPAGSHGITIESDDVTLDLMGFSLIGQGTGLYNGIYMANRNSVEIRNGIIKSFPDDGIGSNVFENFGCRVINVRTHNNGDTGISLLGKSHLVQGCTSYSNYLGNGITVGSTSKVMDCITYSNGSDGIQLDDNSIAMSNTSYDHATGIYGVGEAVTILSNTCLNNNTGISASIDTLIKGNTVYSSTNYGIRAQDGSLIIQNIASGSGTENISNCTCKFVDNVPSIPSSL